MRRKIDKCLMQNFMRKTIISTKQKTKHDTSSYKAIILKKNSILLLRHDHKLPETDSLLIMLFAHFLLSLNALHSSLLFLRAMSTKLAPIYLIISYK